jgi:ACS family pantothenate transporter-like MFS transporter
MFSGYLQAAIYKGLEGAHGLRGWQWLFIMNGVISVPIAVAGLYALPDLPENTRARWLSKDQIVVAQQRMTKIHRAPRTGLGWSTLKRVFGRWHVYLLSAMYTIFILSVSCKMYPWKICHWLTFLIGPFQQHQSNGAVAEVRRLLDVPCQHSADDYIRGRALVLCVCAGFGLFSSIVLAVWDVPIGLKWFAFEVYRFSAPYGPLSYAWAK